MSATPEKIDAPRIHTLIFGGGVAALWTHAYFNRQGVRSILASDRALGEGQSIASQGMIHGGQRYTLAGKWGSQSDALSKMPEYWENCLRANGSQCPGYLPLSNTQVLSSHQYLWSEGGFFSAATTFLASKVMQTKTASVGADKVDKIFGSSLRKDPHFSQAKIFELPERVIEVKSLLKNLAELSPKGSIIQDKWMNIQRKENGFEVSFEKMPPLFAQNLLFASGVGNERAAQFFKDSSCTQRRPLKQVLVKELDFPFYGHAITVDPRPRITITAHPIGQDTAGKKYVWYLGGLVANFASEHSETAALKNAYQELRALFPSIDWKKKLWQLHAVDRAEPATQKSFMPDTPVFLEYDGAWVGWPTKMTFTPLFAHQAFEKICKNSQQVNSNLPEVPESKMPELAQYPWETISDSKWIKTESFL